MTNLIERLRDGLVSQETSSEAADLIENLKNQLLALSNQPPVGYLGLNKHGQITKFRTSQFNGSMALYEAALPVNLTMIYQVQQEYTKLWKDCTAEEFLSCLGNGYGTRIVYIEKATKP